MRLFAIGDIQGCAGAFDALLRKIAFRPSRDRLWLVGDLVNRGPASLAVLRRVMGLGRSVTCVLGNHDLHLLATVAGRRELSPADTFDDVLEAPDLGDIVDWLRSRPLLRYDATGRRVLVHAGIPPRWSVAEALAEAREVEARLRGRKWRSALREMYGGEPSAWSSKLRAADRRRYTINALTRMRYVDRRGHLDLSYSGPPGTQPKGLVPWFDFKERRAANTEIVVGHWAALGLVRRPDLTALDTGCVWGNYLTAVRLDLPTRPSTRVSAAAVAALRRRLSRRN
jgi:bis(5'-nucleosyl)-tetraphosphatase (symmetrical)